MLTEVTSFGILLLLVNCVMAQSPVALTIDKQNHKSTVPPDFIGLSIEIGSLRYGNGGVSGNWFDDSTNVPTVLHAQMITLVRNLGIRNIRVGGGSVDQNNIIPTNGDIDAFFRFVKATDLSVIYSLRLLNGDISQNTEIAKYVWNNYRQYLKTFSIGNEPDFHSYHSYPGHIVDSTIYETDPGVPGSAFPSYLSRWKVFASAVSAAIPDAKFGGPETGSNYPVPSANGTYANTYYLGLPWTVQFADSTKAQGNVSEIYLHNYAGQGASGTPQGMADAMLSAAWDTSYYPALYNSTCVRVLQAGLPYRLTESNSFSGGISGGSTSFATSLFALDYMHWWAAHDASSVNFHNKQWVLNDTIFMDSMGNYQVHSMGYGIAAFNIGGHGTVDSVTVIDPNKLNLVAYAVTDTNGRLFVTVINKEHSTSMPFSPAPRDAEVSISASGFPDTAAVMYLAAPGGNVLDTAGVTLGGAKISNRARFPGKWSPIDTVRAGYYVVRVPRSSAAIVRIGGDFVSIQTPLLLAPKGDSGVPRRATLNWKNSRGSTGYDLQIAGDRGFTFMAFDTTLTDTTFQLSAPLNASTRYYWRVRGSDSLFTGTYSAADSFTTGTGILAVAESVGVPKVFSLSQNYPNPFNPSTVISYELPVRNHVTLKVYDVLGREVATLVNLEQNAGSHSVAFNAGRLPSGVYFYRLSAGRFTAEKKMMVLK